MCRYVILNLSFNCLYSFRITYCRTFFFVDTEYTISTGNDYRYHYIVDNGVDVRGQTSITFQVMACNDAHIALSKDKGVDRQNTYEIVIGGWADSMSVIRG